MGKETAEAKATAADLRPISNESSATDRRRWYNIFPAVAWLGAYQPNWLRADLIAGVTLAAYLMPAGLADASLANLLQLATHGYHGDVCYLSARGSIARRSRWRRRLTILGSGFVHGVDCRRTGFHRVAGQGRGDRELHFRKRPRGVQVRYRFVYSQHTVAQAFRLQRIAWRFLGALGLFLFTPGRNKYGVAPARSWSRGWTSAASA